MSTFTDSAKKSMDKAIDALKFNFSRVRTGRANAHVLDGISVEYYGQPTPITQLAGVKVPEGSVKIRLYILIPRNSPVCDNPGRHGVDAEVRRDVCKVGPLRVHHPDFRWHLCHTVISSFLLKFYCRLYSFSRLLRSRQSGSCVSTILQKACE